MPSGSQSGSGGIPGEYPWDHVYVDGDQLNSWRVYRPFYREISKRFLAVYGRSLYPKATYPDGAGYPFHTAKEPASSYLQDDVAATVPRGRRDAFVQAVSSPFSAPLNGRDLGVFAGYRYAQANGGLPITYGGYNPNDPDQPQPGTCLTIIEARAADPLGIGDPDHMGLRRYAGSGTPPIAYRGMSWQALQLMVLGLTGYFIEREHKDTTDAAFWQNYTTPGGIYSSDPPAPPRHCGSGSGSGSASGVSSGSVAGETAPLTIDHLLPYWPNGCGFTRKREREITSLGAAGSPGQRARFTVWTTARYQDASATKQTEVQFGLGELMPPTPAGQRRYSFAVMEYGGPGSGSGSGSSEPVYWHVAADQTVGPDILTFYGVNKAGDIIGPWIANDLRNAIDQLTIQIYQPTGFFSGGFTQPHGVDWWPNCYACAGDTATRGNDNYESHDPRPGKGDTSTCDFRPSQSPYSQAYPQYGDGTPANASVYYGVYRQKYTAAPYVMTLIDAKANVTAYVHKYTGAYSPVDKDGTHGGTITGERVKLTWSGKGEKLIPCNTCQPSPYVLRADLLDPGYGPASETSQTDISYGDGGHAFPGNPKFVYAPLAGDVAYAYIDWAEGFAATDGGYGPRDKGIQPCMPFDCVPEGSAGSGGSAGSIGSQVGSNGSTGSQVGSNGSTGSYVGSGGSLGGGGPGSNTGGGGSTNGSGGSYVGPGGGSGGSYAGNGSGGSYNGSGSTGNGGGYRATAYSAGFRIGTNTLP